MFLIYLITSLARTDIGSIHSYFLPIRMCFTLGAQMGVHIETLQRIIMQDNYSTKLTTYDVRLSWRRRWRSRRCDD